MQPTETTEFLNRARSLNRSLMDEAVRISAEMRKDAQYYWARLATISALFVLAVIAFGGLMRIL